jgi:anthranilate synthase component 2
VLRSDSIGCDGIARLAPAAIVISPGPKDPDHAGCSMQVIRNFCGSIPILGVCLGHQAIGQALGGKITRAKEPMHGKASWIEHKSERLLVGLPERFEVGRYHSLAIDPESLPACLAPTAWTADGTIMAIEHRDYPVFGVQFHPESILTQHGYAILSNFLAQAGLKCASIPASDLS